MNPLYGVHNLKDRELQLAERVRSACLQAALEAYEDGGLRGLCAEGRWEYALEAIRSLALAPLLRLDQPEEGQGGEPKATSYEGPG